VRHTDNHARIRLTADWLNQWAELAYAVTGTRAQGMTVDVAGSLLRPDTTRNAAYTQLTRAIQENLLFLVTDTVLDPDGEPVDQVHLDPRAAFATILARTDDDTVAHERLAAATAGEQSIRTLARRYQYVYDLVATNRADTSHTAAALDPDRLANLATLPAPLAHAIHADPAWPALADRPQTIASHGGDAAAELAAAPAARELDTADSFAQVLHWRLGQRVPDLCAPTPAVRSRLPVAPWLPAPPVGGPAELADLRDYLHRTSAAIQTRALTLAATLDTSGWAAALGEPPPAGPARQDWFLLTARITAYREAFTITSATPLGDLPEHAGTGQSLTHQALTQSLATAATRTTDPVVAEPVHGPAARQLATHHAVVAADVVRTTDHMLFESGNGSAGRQFTAHGTAVAADIVRTTEPERAEPRQGLATQQLTAHRAALAARVAAIAAAEPIHAAYRAATADLTALETTHAALLRQHTRWGPRRRQLADQIRAAETEIAARRAALDAHAARLGEATAHAGPTHEWPAARAEHAALEANLPNALTAAQALDRTTPMPVHPAPPQPDPPHHRLAPHL
jgi:hypothetical protein